MIEHFVDNLAGGLPYSFGLGMVTAVSPCGIAMLPVYISLHLGMNEEGYVTKSALRRLGHALLMSGVVTLGFIGLFGVIGAILSPIGELLRPIIPWVAVVIGVILIMLGIYFVAGGHFYTNLPARLASRLNQKGGVGVKGFFVFGIAYGLTALSCTIGLFMGLVLNAVASGGFATGLLQFFLFALGMGLIIAIVTIGLALFKESMNRWLHRLVPIVARFSGLLLIFAGSYILYFWFIEGKLLS
jgi:cytochrome c biogenesis protein CcdA